MNSISQYQPSAEQYPTRRGPESTINITRAGWPASHNWSQRQEGNCMPIELYEPQDKRDSTGAFMSRVWLWRLSSSKSRMVLTNTELFAQAVSNLPPSSSSIAGIQSECTRDRTCSAKSHPSGWYKVQQSVRKETHWGIRSQEQTWQWEWTFQVKSRG